MTKQINLPSSSDLVIILTPLVLLILPIYSPGKESLCAYVILLTSIFWISACLPIAVTGAIPALLFSVTGLLTTKEVTNSFFFSGIWLLFGVYMVAIAIQSTNLHMKLALKILITIGTDSKRLILGFMLTAFFLSMFITNTSVTAMLMPIGEKVLDKLRSSVEAVKDGDSNEKDDESEDLVEKLEEKSLESIDDTESSFASSTKNVTTSSSNSSKSSKEIKSLSKAVALCIPYACSIGGTCTLTGSVGNVLVVSILYTMFPESEKISYGTWLVYCTPGSVLTLILSYIWIVWLYFGWRKKTLLSVEDSNMKIRSLLLDQYRSLGPLNWAQIWVIVISVLTATLWFTRNPGFVSGWSVLFPAGYISDGTVAFGCGFLLFLLPRNKPALFKTKGSKCEIQSRKILTFKEFEELFCWDVLFIAGGGMLLAAGAKSSGLTDLVAEALSHMGSINPWILCFIVTILASLLTECTTNMAVVSLMIPAIAKLAVLVRVHPYYFCFPVYLSTALAYMLPVATPPNAIAYSTGLFSIKDMIKTGWLMNIIGSLVINVLINTYGVAYFHLNQFPSWAEPNNDTNINIFDPNIGTTTTAST